MNYANIPTTTETLHTYFDHTDDFQLKILAIAANAIVARERKLAARARVRWTPAVAIEHANAVHARERFVSGMPSDSAARRELRAALIDAAPNA